MKVHLELLYHFKCDNCNHWWTIGDYANVINLNEIERAVYCPSCSYINYIDEIRNGFGEQLL